jgi:hypothetical protein
VPSFQWALSEPRAQASGFLEFCKSLDRLSGGGSGIGYFKPTTQAVAVHDELKEQEATYRQRLTLLVEKEVAAFNSLSRQRNIQNSIAR